MANTYESHLHTQHISALNGYSLYALNCNMRDIEHAVVASNHRLYAEQTSHQLLVRSMSYKHLQHQVTGLASVLLNLQSSHAYGRVVSDPIEGAPYNERPLLVLRNAAGA